MCLPHTLAHPLIFPSAVESHLSELQLSKHKGYLNAFAGATPTICSYFHRREVLGVQMSEIFSWRVGDLRKFVLAKISRYTVSEYPLVPTCSDK